MQTSKTLIRLGWCPGWSVCWVHRSFCWFCHVQADIIFTTQKHNRLNYCLLYDSAWPFWEEWAIRQRNKLCNKKTLEPPHDKTNKMACAPSEDSDQPGHPPSLIRVFAVRLKKAWVLSYPLSAQWRFWSVWADAQSDPSLRLAQSHFVGFAMRWLKS